MKKIIPAVCMSLLGLAVVGTGSYAWFSANATVKATGLSISAKVGASLHIYKGYTDTTSLITDTQIDFETSVVGAKPVALKMESNALKAKVPNEWTTAPTLSTSGVVKNYKDIGTYDIQNGLKDGSTAVTGYTCDGVASIIRKSDADAGTFSLEIKAAVAQVSAKAVLDQALMAGFLVDNGAEGAVNFYETRGVDGDGNPTAGFGELSTSADTVYTYAKITGLKDNTIYHFRFIEWFDGDSQFCTTNAATETNPRAVSFIMNAE